MKKILLFLLCIFFCGKCEKDIKDIPDVGQSSEYKDTVDIHLSNIKDPRVNAIKVTLKNLDGIKPHFNIGYSIGPKKNASDGEDAFTISKDKEGGFAIKQARMEYDFLEIGYFRDVFIAFTPPYDDEKLELSLGKKRIYEMKLYLNDKLFFTKKISFTPERYKEGPLKEGLSEAGSMRSAHKIEVDDMKYVFSITRHYYHFNSYFCQMMITDDDIKKWLDGKP